ncbi:MAG TPA: sugar phosphate isomerase/epimerase, partial [Gemmatimonadaceae bacterium]|nr:sugar phosphate isomerase/epimerase [Gemmatimonadaceae bacterium]
DRRTFVHALAASLGGTRIVSSCQWASARLDRIGLELYSVRDAMKLDPERTLAAVRAMGYSDVELLWSLGNFGRSTQQVRASLDHEGLRAPSAHMAPEVILTDWNKSLDTAKRLGHEYLIVPSLTIDPKHVLDDWRRWADRFNTAGAAARRAGIWLAFHNEPDHLKPTDGTIPYDLFLERTDPSVVRLQLDVGNMAQGGGDPMRYLERNRDRYWSFHVKDVVADRSHDIELGKGNLDFRGLLRAIPDIKRKSVYVEQEAAADPMASAKQNYQFLAALDF